MRSGTPIHMLGLPGSPMPGSVGRCPALGGRRCPDLLVRSAKHSSQTGAFSIAHMGGMRHLGDTNLSFSRMFRPSVLVTPSGNRTIGQAYHNWRLRMAVFGQRLGQGLGLDLFKHQSRPAPYSQVA